MKNTRIYHDKPISNQQTIQLSEQASRHLVSVLRATIGDEIILFDGSGTDYSAKISTISKKQVELCISDSVYADNESPLRISLFQAVSKGDRMDYAIQKSVELGVSEITPVISERTVVRIDDKRESKKIEHWKNIIISACEQSGRSVIPRLNPMIAFSELIKSIDTSSSYILSPYGEVKISSLAKNSRHFQILVGPEGGFSESEISQAKMKSIIELCIGKRVLRTETAPVAVLAALQTIAGDF